VNIFAYLMNYCHMKRIFTNGIRILEVKVQQSHYRPGHALRVPGGWGSQIAGQLAHEGGNVSPTHSRPLPRRKYYWYSFLLEAESTPGPYFWPEGLYQWKIPVTPLEIKPTTFRLVAQSLNELRHCVPRVRIVLEYECSGMWYCEDSCCWSEEMYLFYWM